MILTAYLDESGTHADAPTIYVGGFLGTQEQWQIFENQLAALQTRYGFDIFHGTDFRGARKAFAGWPVETRLRLVEELTGLVEVALTDGAFMPLSKERYRREYRAGPAPKKSVYDSAYGLCFRACLVHFLEICATHPDIGSSNNRLNVVIEDGAANVGDARRIFEEVRGSLDAAGFPPLLDTLEIAPKEGRAPLMAADFLVYSMNLRDQLALASHGSDGDLTPANDTGSSFTELHIDDLSELARHFDRLAVDRKRTQDRAKT